MELAFDGFFEKHHLKLQQYLQLLKYEKSFQEVGIHALIMHPYMLKLHAVGKMYNYSEQCKIVLHNPCVPL